MGTKSSTLQGPGHPTLRPSGSCTPVTGSYCRSSNGVPGHKRSPWRVCQGPWGRAAHGCRAYHGPQQSQRLWLRAPTCPHPRPRPPWPLSPLLPPPGLPGVTGAVPPPPALTQRPVSGLWAQRAAFQVQEVPADWAQGHGRSSAPLADRRGRPREVDPSLSPHPALHCAETVFVNPELPH